MKIFPFHSATSPMYGIFAVVVSHDDRADDVITFAKHIGAVYLGEGELKVVVHFSGRDVEWYTPAELRTLMRPRYQRDSNTPGVGVNFYSDDEVPHGPVELIGTAYPIAGISLPAAALQIGFSWVEAYNVITFNKKK